MQKGDYQAAEKYIREATIARPAVAEYWTGLGMAQAAQNKSLDAEASYEISLALLVAENPRRFADEAMILGYLGRINEAEEAIKNYNSTHDPDIDISTFLDDEFKTFQIK